jgi:PAS domain-containing protein
MKSPSKPEDEESRLQELRDLQILDTAPERNFDELVDLVAKILDVPIALVSLVDEDRQWFKARQPLVVEDTLEDSRFFDNPLVSGDPHIRFYAGYPLRGAEGSVLGTVCAIDTKPREISSSDRDYLALICRQAEDQMRLRATSMQEQQLKGLAETSNDLLIVTTDELHPTFMNVAARRYLGGLAEQEVPRVKINILPGLDTEKFQKSEEAPYQASIALAFEGKEEVVAATLSRVPSPGGFSVAITARSRAAATLPMETNLRFAKKGDSRAQNNLGFMYANGISVARDYRKAYAWYRKAARQGHPGAQSNLGVLYALGKGVSKDLVESMAWFTLAASNGNVDALKNLQELDLKISPDERAEARDRAAKMGLAVDRAPAKSSID